jgi:hypothetical protein
MRKDVPRHKNRDFPFAEVLMNQEEWPVFNDSRRRVANGIEKRVGCFYKGHH